MINYSIVMRGNPSDSTAEKKAYACAQYSEIMELGDFAKHIADHGCVYNRADIAAVLTFAVDCMRELLLQGQRIRMGEMGTFYVTLSSKGADSAADFTAGNITDVNVKWSAGEQFENLLDDAEFNLVATRRAAQAVVRALKAGETIVDLSASSDSSDSSGSEEGDAENTGDVTDENTGTGDDDDSGDDGSM